MGGLKTGSTTRIELWSAAHTIWPGTSAAGLERDDEGWRYGTT